ncbi:MAG: two-component system, cell cycle response regulator DivK, partial [Tenuifilum sp.]|nr:two-component system, cell cycle response regulator DivK [Tenuifilum sp.]
MERDWNDKTILIVEDDKFNSLIIKNFLSKTKA